ncbi:MAG TPA: hypothetical protein VGA32_06125 [Anaerolineales bacterium]
MRGLRPTMSNLARRPEVRLAAILGLLAAAERLVLWEFYAPIEYNDTRAYFRLAEVLSTWNLAGYDGSRVPGYPAFVALLGRDPSTVWAVQLLLGWGLTMLLFLLTWWTTGRATLALLVGGLYSLLPGLFLFESNLLTETLTSFLAVAAVVLVAWLDRGVPFRGRGLVLVIAGMAAAGTGLARALFFAFPAWLLPFVLTSGAKGSRARAGDGALFLAPAAILLGGWLGFMRLQYGVFAPDAVGGYHLIQHTGAFFEYVPDEHAALRDTYLKYRQARAAEHRDPTNAIWDAIPEMSDVTGLGFYDLSREVQRISVQLILAHPDLYIRSVIDGWIGFWKAPVYWDPAQVEGEALRGALSILAGIGRGICWAANGAFLALSLAALISRRMRGVLKVDRVLVLTGGWLWLFSVLQTLPGDSDNPRFLVPLQMLVIFAVVRSLAGPAEEVRWESAPREV